MVNKYFVPPITIFEDSITKTISETKVKRPNIFSWDYNEPKYYEVDGVRISFKIPFDGSKDLFEIRPSQFILLKFECETFSSPHGQECGDFVLSFDFSKQELQNKEDLAAHVDITFKNEFKHYKDMISYVNIDANSYNNGLRKQFLQRLEKRREKASSFAAISEALCIPLTPSKNAPNTIPIPLKRINRTPMKRPTTVYLPEECISDADYENINNIITMCGTTMENTARTYYMNSEEELRDHLLATLNTHYESATGETFRKIGKTDIQIEFENKAAFIGECKIWHGEKAFKDAIQQILNYSTWRDVKVSVIIFNKENQNFKRILEQVNSWAKENAQNYNLLRPNVLKCRYHRLDMNINIDLSIMVFDLYVDKTQFKDIRLAR